MANFIIWKDNLAAFVASEFKFEQFKSGGICEKHAVATWKGGTISALNPEMLLNNTLKMQFLSNRKHTACPLQRSVC
jgi:hypothetical protein